MSGDSPVEPPAPPRAAARLDLLDALRGAAAGYIVLHHYVRVNLSELAPGLPRFFPFGQAAVMLFFLLSGFVVYYSSVATRPSFTNRWYLIRRFRRIYPPFVIALFVSWLCVGLRGAGWAVDVPRLIGHLLMLHNKLDHPGVWFPPFAGNHPLWSLAFEWWFYMLFLVFWRIGGHRPERLRYGVAALTAVAFAAFAVVPNQFAVYLIYFSIWWAGVELGREWCRSGQITVREQAFPFLLIVVTGLAWPVVRWLPWHEVGEGAWVYPNIQVRQFLTAAAILAIGYGWYRLSAPGQNLIVRSFLWLAPTSYALYVLHEPVLVLAHTLRLTPNGLFDALWLAPLLFGLAWLVEIPLQKRVNRLLN